MQTTSLLMQSRPRSHGATEFLLSSRSRRFVLCVLRACRQTSMAPFVGAIAFLLVCGSAAVAQDKIATTAGQFLSIAVGPRATAMGSAYVAEGRDATSLYWNPGAFQQAERSELVFSHTNWLVDSKFQWFGFMLNFGDENAVGVSLTQLNYGEDEVTTVAAPNGTGERWSARDLAVAVSYCRRLTDRFSMGASAKYVEQRIWNETASTFAFDLGLLFVTGFNGMRLGVSMTNFGGDLKLEGRDLLQQVDFDPANSGSNKALVGTLKTDPWELPLQFRIGLAMDVFQEEEFRLTVAADGVRPTDNVAYINTGGELAWNDMVFLRGGYKSLFAGEREDGLSLGAGVRLTQVGLGSVEFDYAYTQFGIFGNLNTFALSIAF